MTEHVVEISRSTDQVDEEPDERQIIDWLNDALNRLDCGQSEVSVRIVSEDEMTLLNRQYRNRNQPTNVLSFPSGLEAEGRLFLGDIVVCAAVVRREALEFDKPVEDRYAHMVFHGLLHLLGHEHAEPAGQEKMEALEKSLLASLNIADPYELVNDTLEKGR